MFQTKKKQSRSEDIWIMVTSLNQLRISQTPKMWSNVSHLSSRTTPSNLVIYK